MWVAWSQFLSLNIIKHENFRGVGCHTSDDNQRSYKELWFEQTFPPTFSNQWPLSPSCPARICRWCWSSPQVLLHHQPPLPLNGCRSALLQDPNPAKSRRSCWWSTLGALLLKLWFKTQPIHVHQTKGQHRPTIKSKHPKGQPVL